jgi:hypothetical protein
MIGANPPGGMVWNPQKSDELIKRYGELWAKDPQASARCPDLVDAIRKVNDDMPRRWLFLPIHPGNDKAAAFSVLSERVTAAMVFDTYCAAANGDPSGLWLASLVARFVFPEVVNWGDNASKAVSVRWGYPTQAKLIVGGVLLAAVALISIAWLAVRFMRGRENRRT